MKINSLAEAKSLNMYKFEKASTGIGRFDQFLFIPRWEMISKSSKNQS